MDARACEPGQRLGYCSLSDSEQINEFILYPDFTILVPVYKLYPAISKKDWGAIYELLEMAEI